MPITWAGITIVLAVTFLADLAKKIIAKLRE
jgi:hypothetical protein